MRTVLGTLVLAGVLAGCRSKQPLPDLGPIYDSTAQSGELDRNPVILIPGILGSNLDQASTGRG